MVLILKCIRMFFRCIVLNTSEEWIILGKDEIHHSLPLPLGSRRLLLKGMGMRKFSIQSVLEETVAEVMMPFVKISSVI